MNNDLRIDDALTTITTEDQDRLALLAEHLTDDNVRFLARMLLAVMLQVEDAQTVESGDSLDG